VVRKRLRLAGAAAVAAAALALAPGAAGADPITVAPPTSGADVGCPGALPAYSGTDVVVAELRALRAEQIQQCNVTKKMTALLIAWQTQWDTGTGARFSGLGGKLDTLHGDSGDLLTAVGGTTTAVGTVKTAVDAAKTQAHADVTAPPAADLTPVVTSVEGSGEAVRSTLWFLAGLLCITVVAPLAAREFRA
jgi:hypothetical protein